MKKGFSLNTLGSREREIMEAVFQAGEASVQEVRSRLKEPPSYSAVRTMVRHLESKGLLTHRSDGTRYLYRAVESKRRASQGAVKQLLQTFFQGSPSAAVTAILDLESKRMSDDELARLEQLIRDARRKESP